MLERPRTSERRLESEKKAKKTRKKSLLLFFLNDENSTGRGKEPRAFIAGRTQEMYSRNDGIYILSEAGR